MNLTDPTTTQATAAKAVKPGTPAGAYADPAQMGAMIQKMYPQYANFDPVTLGQRWIDLHTPKAAAGAAGTDLTLSPGASATSTNPNTPDLSGLAKFAQPIKPQAPKIIITGLSGNNPNGAQLDPMTQPQQPYQQPQPQAPKLSTFNINKAGF